MLNVYYHHELGVLADHLINRLVHRQPFNPLSPDTIIVPNRDTARWVTLRFADKTGIAANLKWMLPSEWTWSLVRRMNPDLPMLLASDKTPMLWRLYSLFGNRDIWQRFPVVKSYMEDREPEAEDSYRWQLADKIASAFDQYQVYRPDMLRRWERGETGANEELWQAELWKLLVQVWGKQNGTSRQKHRADYYYELLQYIRDGGLADADPLCIFNPGRLTEPFLELTAQYSTNNEVALYSVNAGTEESFGTGNSEILNSFGEEMFTSRTLVEMFVNREQIHHLQPSVSPSGYSTHLQRIKSTILSGDAFPELGSDDGSIKIHSCHSPLREVETLRDTLLERFSEQNGQDSLCPEDVLVVTPDLRTYKPVIDAVFSVRESGIPQIPYHIALPEYSTTGGIFRAFLHLIELSGSRLEIDEVMEFINHEPVRQSFRLSDTDTATIRRWFEENKVIWGFNSDHRSHFNQPETTLNTWSSALNRGWTGQLAADQPGVMISGELPYTGVENADHQLLWAKVQKILYLLYETILDSRQQRPCKEWGELLKRRSKALFGRYHNDSDDLNDLLKMIGALETEADAAEFNEAVPFDVIRHRLQTVFEDQRTGSVSFTRGVIFSSMVPVRSIPFKMIACLGLNNDQFPRRFVDNPVDLIAKYPKRGERNRKSVDRNLFLESILATEQFHWCSYIGKSQQDNEPIPPSPILEEWIRLISTSRPENSPPVVRQESLHGFSRENFNSDYRGLSHSYLKAARIIESDSGKKGVYRGETLPVQETEEPVSLPDLEMFCKNPFKYFCNRQLNIYLNDNEISRDDTEFQPSPLDRHILFQSLFNWKLTGVTDREIETAVSNSGILPAGWPGKRSLNDLIQSVNLAFEELNKVNSTIEPTFLELNPELHSSGLTGSVQSLSKHLLLEINPSRCSGKHLLTVWVRHLALSCMGGLDKERTLMLFGLRAKEPVWKHFAPVSQPVELLETVIHTFRQGLKRPLPLFPETAYAYIESLKSGVGEVSALEKAIQSEWSRVNFKTKRRFGNQTDPYTVFLYGEDADLSGESFNDFPKAASAIFSPLYDHLEEGTG